MKELFKGILGLKLAQLKIGLLEVKHYTHSTLYYTTTGIVVGLQRAGNILFVWNRKSQRKYHNRVIKVLDMIDNFWRKL